MEHRGPSPKGGNVFNNITMPTYYELNFTNNNVPLS